MTVVQHLDYYPTMSSGKLHATEQGLSYTLMRNAVGWPHVDLEEFNRDQEMLNGAEFEIWFRRGVNYFGWRVQAKRAIPDGKFAELRHKVGHVLARPSRVDVDSRRRLVDPGWKSVEPTSLAKKNRKWQPPIFTGTKLNGPPNQFSVDVVGWSKEELNFKDWDQSETRAQSKWDLIQRCGSLDVNSEPIEELRVGDGYR
jgi:hypothetical protein